MSAFLLHIYTPTINVLPCYQQELIPTLTSRFAQSSNRTKKSTKNQLTLKAPPQAQAYKKRA